jgi:hypothetical protein
MIIPEIQNPITFFSAYGYLDVNKNDYEDPQKIVIPFVERRKYKLWGSIKVK